MEEKTKKENSKKKAKSEANGTVDPEEGKRLNEVEATRLNLMTPEERRQEKIDAARHRQWRLAQGRDRFLVRQLLITEGLLLRPMLMTELVADSLIPLLL